MNNSKRILVVEDDKALLPIISYNLEKKGFFLTQIMGSIQDLKNEKNVLTYFGLPYNTINFEEIGYIDLNGFKYAKAQFIPYLNIKMSAHLAEDIYTKKDFRDWNSSKWCWENPKYYEKKWRNEGF